MMRVTERSYGGSIFRPRPEIVISSDQRSLFVVTPWGSRSAAMKVARSLADHTAGARADTEATNPFERQPGLSDLSNVLNSALTLSNDLILREENRDELTVGLEVIAIARNENELAMAQVGAGFVLLDRPGFDLQPLMAAPDLSTSFSSQRCLAPLPSDLLGVETRPNIRHVCLRLTPGDRLFMLLRSFLPARVLAQPSLERTAENLTQTLSHHSTEMPFWIGHIEF